MRFALIVEMKRICGWIWIETPTVFRPANHIKEQLVVILVFPAFVNADERPVFVT
jgi:hypothetical protein